MTTPMGDLPDWQTLVTPNVAPNAILSQGPNGNGQIRQSGSPFRVWTVWLQATLSSNASFVAGINRVTCQVQDGAGNILLGLTLAIQAANQFTNAGLTLPVPGMTPLQFGGNWAIQLVTGNTGANTDFHASGGILFSAP